jgi:LuxR family maltose regulon positive regulatory protein
MQNTEFNAPLIQTKLHRPVQTKDLIQRPRLNDWLDARWERSFILVSAPAGYGKSTFISEWAQSLDCPSAWVSLDEYDNDLSVFLGYLIAAIQQIFPQSLKEMRAMLSAAELPPTRYLAGSLINELNEIGGAFVLVLDDYYLIELQEIHDLVNQLINYAPKEMHLVVCTRIDPPLPMVKFRARGQVTEIRGQDLVFTEDEGYLLVQNLLGTQVDRKETDALVAQSEGWVTGIRLAALALRHREGQEAIGGQLSANNRYVTEYLVAEILENQVAVFSEGLLKTSILNRMCPDLCEAVCAPGRNSGDSGINGQVFFDWLEGSNLFVIQLDDKGEWVRYHHLFREFLQREMKKRYSVEEIASLQLRASAWFESNELIEEALRYALTADDTDTAINIIIQHRHTPLNQENGQRLERWLNLLPPEAIEQEPQLLLSKAWSLNHQLRLAEMVPIVEQAAAMLEKDNLVLTPDERQVLGGEVAVLRSIPLTWMGQGQQALEFLSHALETTPMEHKWVRGIVLTFYPVALHLAGQLDKAHIEIQNILGKSSTLANAFKHRAYISLISIEILVGNLIAVEQAAMQFKELVQQRQLHDSIGWLHYSFGFVHYQRNELDKARQHFEQLIEMRYLANSGAVAQAHYGLALTYQALGNPAQAQETIQSIMPWAMETGYTDMQIEVESLYSRLSLQQGQIPDPSQWVVKLGVPGILMFLLHNPHLTLANVLLAQGTPETLQEAEDLLAQLQQLSEATHTTWRMMEITAMQALFKAAVGNQESALKLLTKVLQWAKPYGYIRLFTDMGPMMEILLKSLTPRKKSEQAYVRKILAAFPVDAGQPAEKNIQPRSQTASLVDPLTNREFEIMELLGKRMTNMEIATELHISVGTVQQHLNRIYSKLDVKGRRQAASKAEALGLIPHHSSR